MMKQPYTSPELTIDWFEQEDICVYSDPEMSNPGGDIVHPEGSEGI